jgi:glycosyltransferase involved in cell wall biosynthesis
MKILLIAHVFSPSIGGIETCSLNLALAFAKLGHEVQVITQTLSNNPDDDHGLKVIRRPGKSALFQAIRWCDVFFQNNISLQTAWPLLFIRRPWVVCTATWLRNPDGSTGMAGHLKRLALRFATNIYISKAIRDHVGYPGFLVPNPYDGETFRVIPEIKRGGSLVFLGRLVSDKGCDLLVQSLARLRDAGLALPLTIIGTGPEEAALKNLVIAEKLEGLVRFAGALRGDALARELNRHEVLVVPSRWAEPFGIVALEGIACGCPVVGSAGGGLPDAMGQCGVLFKNGDVEDMTRAIREVFGQRQDLQYFQATVADHLKAHRMEVIATRYVEIFERLCGHNFMEKSFLKLKGKFAR